MSHKGQNYRIYSFEEKKQILEQYFEKGLSIPETAQFYKIGGETVRGWLKKIDYDMANVEKLKHARYPATKRNKLHTTILPDWIKEEIKVLLKKNPNIGPLKIRQYMHRVHQELVSASLIYFYLKSEGIIDKRKRKPKEKKKHTRSFEYPYPCAAVQIDLLELRLINKNKIYLITFLDDYSRFILLSRFVTEPIMAEVIKCLITVIKDVGVMERILCDKGTQFVSWHGFTEFEERLCDFDIELIASGPEKPQNQGKLERWHRSYREEHLVKFGQYSSLAQAQLETNRFVDYYNFERPHQGIGGLFPADRFFGIADDLTKELALYKTEQRKNQKIYFCCNINGKKLVISGPRNGELKIHLDGEKISDGE